MTRSRGDEFAAAAAEACRRLLTAPDARAEEPPDIPDERRRLCSVRVRAGDRTVVATRRPIASRARKEAAVLRALGREQAPVPAVLAFDGQWLIQEDLGRLRLSKVLRHADPDQGEAWLDHALRALAACQEAGRRAGLERRLPEIRGHRRLLTAPSRLATALGVAEPRLPLDRLVALTHSPQRAFVKWDARPGNAIVGEDGTVRWFDWEGCGCRCRRDDLVWLLTDEWVPDWPEAEERLIAKRLPAFPDDGYPHPPEDYVAVYGVLHMIVRLDVILRSKGDAPWWDPEACLEHDLLGVTLDETAALARRAARWAQRSPLAEPLAPWLEALAPRLRRMGGGGG